jgi:hypothetical protein
MYTDREERGISRGWGIIRRPGRLRRRLEELLAEHGFMVRASEIFQNAPAYRSRCFDGVAWEVYGQRLGENGTIQLHSWDTMADCCREGILISMVGQGYFQVSAKYKNQ